jgi:succinate-semialdehyde dehydrogenase / glutarate-semialdehyde dehydrogenase
MATNGTHELPFKLNDPDLLHQDSYVDGKWVQAKSGKRFDVIDPGSDKTWATCPDNTAEDADAAIQSSYKAFKEYSVLNPRKRAQLLLKWHELITAAKDDLAKIVTYETGKPLAEAYGELDYSLGFTWWFAGEAERIQGSISVPSAPNRRTFVIKQPLGVAVALVPWNFPIAMILRKAGAAFAAGCTMVVKPSPETPLSCLCLANLATRAGFAPGVFNVLTTSLENTPSLSEALIVHPLTKKVTFTGSTRVGKLVAGLCSKGLKKCTLELGGNCPFIVFDDADLEQAAAQFMALKWRHAGQACITANRLYVQAGVYDKFTQIIVDKTKALKVGHGATDGITMGPVTTPRGLAKAEEQAADAVKHGAKMVLGSGKAHKNAKEDDGSGKGQGVGGYFMDPTIMTGMTADMLMSREETFAPVCGLYKFETEEEVVKVANDTSMGLASYAFTKNVDRLWRMLENLEAGMIGLVSFLSSYVVDMQEGMLIDVRRTPVTRRRRSRRSVGSRRAATVRSLARMSLSMSTSSRRLVRSLSPGSTRLKEDATCGLEPEGQNVACRSFSVGSESKYGLNHVCSRSVSSCVGRLY